MTNVRARIKTEGAAADGVASEPRFVLSHYIGIARPDHWVKNIFVIPGFAAALVITPYQSHTFLLPFAAALITACLAASANYTINEYLDSAFDRFHPTKSRRPGAQGKLDIRIVIGQYLLLVIASGLLAYYINLPFFLTIIWLLLMGIVYNVSPIRTKDKAYLDTLSELINNPIRFLLGWFVVAPEFLPPASALIAYWMGGAFLMGVKRYSEFRGIGDPARAALYRRSFAHYTEQSLLLSSFFYALCSSFFIAVFLIKYKIEFLLTAPLYAALFTWYLALGTRRDSAAAAPEKLYTEVWFMSFAAVTFLISVAVFAVDIPILKSLLDPSVIRIRF